MIVDVASVVLPTVLALWALFHFVLRSTTEKLIDQNVNPKLFKSNGTTIYVPRTVCREDRDDCNSRTCRELARLAQTTDKIMKNQQDMEAKRDAARSDLGKELAKLSEQVSTIKGRFEQYIHDQQNKT